MNNIQNIIEVLESIRKYPTIYVGNVSPDSLLCLLNGFYLGLKTSSNTHENYPNVMKEVLTKKGWNSPSPSFINQMREKNLSDEEVIKELLEIEIETWKILAMN